jgi:hypothetical protein
MARKLARGSALRNAQALGDAVRIGFAIALSLSLSFF